jgi:hypothetical protein
MVSVNIDDIIFNCKKLVKSQMGLLLDRYNRNPDYGWIDTKYDPVTLKDFPDEDLIYGKNTVYSWIQGRALEAITGHAVWLENSGSVDEREISHNLFHIIPTLYSKLQIARDVNHGRLFFFMTPCGKPFVIQDGRPVYLESAPPGRANYSDLFAAKGLYSAAWLLNDSGKIDKAREYCRNVYNAIMQGTFITDQQCLDPKNPSSHSPDRKSHGPYMIAIGMTDLLVKNEPCQENIQMGLNLINYVVQNHINFDKRWPILDRFDFVEFIDNKGDLYKLNGSIILDPGHVMEFIGLTLKFFNTVEMTGSASENQQVIIRFIKPFLLPIFRRVFEFGFLKYGGFCKWFDLISKVPVNSEMPWWPVLETMRTAAFCLKECKEQTDIDFTLNVIRKCYKALFDNFVVNNKYQTIRQMLAPDGSESKSIPATAGMDPGYHTGLALIDFINLFSKRI